MYVKTETGEEAYVECGATRRCGRGADIALCDKDYEADLDEARQAAVDAIVEALDEIEKALREAPIDYSDRKDAFGEALQDVLFKAGL